MNALSKEIYNLIEDHDTLNIETVAKLIGCTKQELSRFLNNKGGLSFRKLLRLSYVLFPDNQEEIMANWCLRINTTESIKQSFEYASITRNKKVLKQLIDLYANDKTVSKYVAVYSILYDFYTDEIGAKDIVSRLNKVGQLAGELAILSDIIKCYNYYYFEKYHLILETAKEAEKLVYQFNDRHLFIKESYLHRIAELLGHVSVHFNDVESARYYASLIINANICAKTVSGAFDIVGMSYLSEDGNECIENLRIRYEIAKTLGEPSIEKMARRNLDYAKLYLNFKLDADSDPILLRLQNNKGSEFELKLLKEAIFQQGEDDFLVLLRACARNSLEKMHECRRYFFKQSNYLFASIAAREAKKLGETSALVDDFIKIKIEIKGDVKFEENFIRCFNRSSHHRCSISA
ncbi:AimR family lysis-lysogeny pheromone receptor [Neobacillus niacini]|uniref:AimR family lysis-lysogeny pheromone receptor n=1 Tax=Neobacillus niacini TaxID=86668 RepID=UPI0028578212|nr:AimR family lysis-lysogeny pheromone receptor [Neobacillus niacini]MDR7001620.1 plasmid maintenance system antidote protein VapI [Neobacillus niacini]